VAVDRAEVVNQGGALQGIVQPVEQPEGWAESALCAAAPSQLMRQSGGSIARSRLIGAPLSPPAPCPPETVDFDALERGREPSQDRAKKREEREQPRGKKARKANRSLRNAVADDLVSKETQQALNQAAQELLQALRSCPTTDPTHRLDLLRQWHDRLEQFHQNLNTSSIQHSAIERYGRAMVRLAQLLSQSQPAENEVQSIWTELETALDEYLNGPAEPQSREGFWK